MNDTNDFLSLPVHHLDVGDGAIAYREVGQGPPLLLVHGWPLWGITWRALLPELSKHHRCIVVDLLGAGQSVWSDKTNFGMKAQARALARLLTKLGVERAGVIAHDTGATIARRLALSAPERVGALMLMGTEIPNHRPPLVELFIRLFGLPGTSSVFGLALRSDRFVRSTLGFGGCFEDRSLIGGDFSEHIVAPLARDRRAREGQIAYARGIDWELVDSLAEDHGRIHQPTLLVWGERDPFFPVERAKEMVGQLANCAGFETLPGRLFIHEERPREIARRALRFFAETRSADRLALT